MNIAVLQQDLLAEGQPAGARERAHGAIEAADEAAVPHSIVQ